MIKSYLWISVTIILQTTAVMLLIIKAGFKADLSNFSLLLIVLTPAFFGTKTTLANESQKNQTKVWNLDREYNLLRKVEGTPQQKKMPK